VSAGSLDRSSTDDGLPPDAEIRSVDGRVARWRARADAAADRYQKRAQDQPLLGLPLALIARYTGRQGMLLASASAFRLFLWLLPLALMAAGILAAVARSQANSASLESASKRAGITGAASQQVVTALHDGHRSWWLAVLFGGVFFLWATRTLMRNLVVVNAHLWGATVPRMRQKHILITTLVFAGACVALIGFAALVSQLDHAIPGGFLATFLLSAIATAWQP
jgi:membrane protein